MLKSFTFTLYSMSESFLVFIFIPCLANMLCIGMVNLSYYEYKLFNCTLTKQGEEKILFRLTVSFSRLSKKQY